MRTKPIHLVLLLPLLPGVMGCAPKEMFSWIDRHCYVADWTNHHSCVSCCNCKNGSCQRPAQGDYPMVELGDPASPDKAIK